MLPAEFSLCELKNHSKFLNNIPPPPPPPEVAIILFQNWKFADLVSYKVKVPRSYSPHITQFLLSAWISPLNRRMCPFWTSEIQNFPGGEHASGPPSKCRSSSGNSHLSLRLSLVKVTLKSLKHLPSGASGQRWRPKFFLFLWKMFDFAPPPPLPQTKFNEIKVGKHSNTSFSV